MKTPFVITSLLVLTASAAHAEVGVQAQILPSVDGHTDDESYSLGTGFGVAAQIGTRLTRNLSVAFAPRLAFDMETEDDDGTWKQLDLAVRVTGHLPLANGKAEVFGYVAPGYSFIFLPDLDIPLIEINDPDGLVLGAGVGGAYEVWPTLSLVADVGYQLGFHSTTVEFDDESRDADISTDILHVGLGIRGTL